MGGGTLMRASERLVEKLKRIAAHMLEAAPEDLEIASSKVFVRGVPSQSVSFAEIGDAAYRRLNGRLPEGEDPTLEERYVFDPENVAWSFGCTAAMVEIDRETGVTQVIDYVVAHDCGTVINPLIVDGQIHGGVAQGIGQALYEELVYDAEGQLITSTLADYILPTFGELPRFTLAHQSTPAPHIPGGLKGMGEAGTIGAPAAVANAIDDALRDLDVTITTIPITPPRLRTILRAAGQTREA
jgi:carbon-monoxide dehydrogenase large subunit